MHTFVLIAIIIMSGGQRPVPITVEFNGLAQCEQARKNLSGQRELYVVYSACERK